MGKNETIICTTYEEFDAFLKEHQHGSIVAYDVETNARNTFSKEHTVIGFSLAFDGDYGCYVPLKALDFQVTPDDKRLIEKRTRNILSTNTVVVYNCSHEYPATRHWLGLELPAVDDVYTMVKLMMGNADKYVGNGGLKMQSVMHLHYDNWSEDLDIYFKTIKDYKKNPLAETALLPLIDAYYEKEEYPYIRSLIEAIPDSEYTLDTMSYEYVPYKLIGKYGSLDSTVLLELREFYINWMLEESKKLGVNLFDGYKYWMQHSYSGYILERNGAYWNDKKAQEVEDWCEKGCKESLEALIRSPLSYPWIMESLRPQFNTWLMKEQGASLLSAHYGVKSMTKSTITVIPNTEEDAQYLKNMSLLPIVKKPTKKNPEGMVTNQYKMGIENFLAYVSKYRDELGFNLESLFRVFCKEYTDEYFSKEHSVDEMKKLLNPTSTSSEFYRFVSKVLIYDDIIVAKIYHTVQEILNAPNFDIDYYKTFYNANKDNICEIETEHKKVWKFPDYKAKHPEIVYIDNPSSDFLQTVQKLSALDDTKMIVSLLKKYITNHSNFLYNYRLSSDLFDAVNYKFDTLDESSILELYSYYEFVGITIEDKSTWNEHFEWLYNYRWYKKYSKLVSTYIKGTVGRKSVWYVFKEDYESGEDSTERLFPYYSPQGEDLRKHPNELEKYDTVLQTRFGTNTADSGRWKATMHTLPSGKTIKGIITSRYKGGVIAMPDCSQAEVRVLARVAEDENLIKAFRDGLDVHRFVASLVFQKTMEEVTPRERKVAKSAVFGILYGETVKSFADEHFNGDIEKAEEVFDYFYTAFPNIKKYVEATHSQYDKFQKVLLPLTGRFIDMSRIERGDDIDRIYRQSQNFPIQGMTCDVAGLILYKIIMYIVEESLKSKPFCYIHDSMEEDLHPDETFKMLDALKPIFNQYPDDAFGIPMASDIVFSCNMGAEIEVEDMVHDNDYNDVTITLKGFENDISEVIDTWNSVYDVVEEDVTYDGGEPKEVYVPLRGLFQQKVVISPEMGTTKREVSKRFHVVRKVTA